MLNLAKTMALIESKLSPYVGAHMAQASTKAHADALGLASSEELSAEQFEALLSRLTKGLRVFVGGGKAEQIMRQIRLELPAEGAG